MIQRVQLHYTAGGDSLEAVLLPYSDERCSVRAVHFFSAGRLVQNGVVSALLSGWWRAIVICTPEFEQFHRRRSLVNPPRCAAELFFADV